MIAYDTNVLIYALESDGPFSEQARSIVLEGEQQGAVLSVLALQEFMTGVVLSGEKPVVSIAELHRQFAGTVFVPVDLPIVERALELTEKYGRKLLQYDAIHLATAIIHGATVFYTNDRHLLKTNLSEINVRAL